MDIFWSNPIRLAIFKFSELELAILNTYRTAVSPTLDLLCHEDFNVGRSEAESSWHNKSNVGRNCCPISVLLYRN